jgi:hypothetical protein
MNGASFVRRGCSVVVQTVILTSGFAAIAGIAIGFRNYLALSRDKKKLLAHFGEAGTAVFAVKEVENGGHDRILSFDHDHGIISLGCDT